MKKAANLEVLYYELHWEERFEAARKDGFKYVEFWGWEDKDLEQVKQLLKDNGLELAGMGGDGPFSMCDPVNKEKYLDYIRKAIEAAKFLDCPNLIIHSDALQSGPQYAVPLSGGCSDTVKKLAMFDIMLTISKWAEEAGITFVLEALNTVTDHLGNFLTNTQTSAELTASTGSANMKILYDAYHMYLNEGKLCETVKKYADNIGYIHIADAPGRHEPGTGVINYKKFFEYLEEIGYEGVVGFELYPEETTEKAVAAIKEAAVTLEK